LTDLPLQILAGVGLIGLLVVIHEFGHFIVAKWFGVGVPVFSVGMGPRLFGVVYKGTDYRLSLLPVGGYVQMAGADPFGEEDPDAFVEPELDFMRKPVWQRLLIMFAGPAFNLILPFILFTFVLMLGEPQRDAVIGTVFGDSAAERAGFKVDDRIVGVAGEPVEVWVDVARALRDHASDGEIAIDIQRGDEFLTVVFPPDAVTFTVDGLVDAEDIGMWTSRPAPRVGVADPKSPAGKAGLETGDRIETVNGDRVETLYDLRAAMSGTGPYELTFLRSTEDADVEDLLAATVRLPDGRSEGDEITDKWGIAPSVVFAGLISPDSAAEEAGVQTGDRIVAVDGAAVHAFRDILRFVKKTVPTDGEAPRALKLSLIRDGLALDLDFAPTIEREVVRGEVVFRPIMGVGIFPESYESGVEVKKYYSLTEAVPRAFDEGIMVFSRTVSVLKNLVTWQLKPKESLGGPIEIFRQAGQAAQRGIFDYARMIGVVSFSLGIINLFPIPVLDGGQIVFYSIEGIRGRPVSMELREKVQMAGLLAMVALFLLVTVNDVSRWLGG
jgi:regulator of sigma E protease